MKNLLKGNRLFYSLVMGFVVMTASAFSQKVDPIPPYKNAKLPVEERLNDLLLRMTLEEKIDLLSGADNDDIDSDTNTNPETDSPATLIRATNFLSKTRRNIRLGIPEFIMTD